MPWRLHVTIENSPVGWFPRKASCRTGKTGHPLCKGRNEFQSGLACIKIFVTHTSGHLEVSMPNPESYRNVIDRVFGELTGIERQSLLLAIQQLDDAARSLGIDVVAELEQGRSLTNLLEIIKECQRKRSA